MNKIPNDKRSLPFGSAFAIQDEDILETIKNSNIDILQTFKDIDLPTIFCNRYIQWIQSTTKNKIKGLENFSHAVYSNGTSESFEKFYIKNHNRRFRCYRGEYMYHQLAWRNSWPNWKFLEDDPLDHNDAVIISLPFANTGDRHSDYDKLLTECSNLKIPVLVDCAYFGICENIEFDFNYSCITDITFSLSKTFPVAYARIGMRLTKHDDDDIMFVYHKIAYQNHIGPALGLVLLDKYSPDYITEKYKNIQLEYCKQLNIVPSKTVLFGIAETGWEEYDRGGSVNRLSLHKYLPIKEINIKEIACQ